MRIGVSRGARHARRIAPPHAAGDTGAVPANAEDFSGSIVRTRSQRMWPFDAGRCSVTAEVIVYHRRRSEWWHSRDDGPLHVTRYRLFPFFARTILWIADGSGRSGFVPLKARPLMASLAGHGWQLKVKTVSWISWLP
jgi:hypothetical protein